MNDATANQGCSNLLPPHPTKQFHSFIASITMLQISRHRTHSATHSICTHHVHAKTALKPASKHLLEVVYKLDHKPIAKLV